MKKNIPTAILVALCTQITAFIDASETTRREYLELISQYPTLIQPLGDSKKGEIQIILDPQEMAAVEKELSRDVGLVKKDKYWLWINDACLFPNGSKGVYGRILWAHSLEASPGVAIMPIMPNGKIVLNCTFRHATRSWEVELPRGLIDPGESPEETAKREALEEAGTIVEDVSLLGKIPPYSGLTNTVTPVFIARVIERNHTHHEDTEAIEELFVLSLDEIRDAFTRGYYEHTIRGEQKRIHFRDPFLAYAILIYELRLGHVSF